MSASRLISTVIANPPGGGPYRLRLHPVQPIDPLHLGLAVGRALLWDFALGAEYTDLWWAYHIDTGQTVALGLCHAPDAAAAHVLLRLRRAYGTDAAIAAEIETRAAAYWRSDVGRWHAGWIAPARPDLAA